MSTSAAVTDKSREENRVVADAVTVVGITLLFVALLGGMTVVVDAPPLVDEPIFADSAFKWSETGQIEISGLSAPIALFDTIWGGAFARIFGATYLSLRWSTIVLTAISAPFVYWTLDQLGAKRSLRAIGLGAYLFNPLVVVLSTTFMTDMHLAALGAIAISLFVRGLNPGGNWKWMAAGATVAGLGFLSRPQALVFPIAALCAAWFAGLRSRHFLGSLAAIATPVLVTVVLYGAWASSETEPFIRELTRDVMLAGLPNSITTYVSLALIASIVYVGLVAMPLLPTIALKLPGGRAGAPLKLVVVSLVVLGVVAIAAGWDPTLRQAWVSQTGLAGVDRSHLGSRPEIWPSMMQVLISLGGVVATGVLAQGVITRWRSERRPVRSFLILALVGCIASAALASMTHPVIHDRYWVPMIPIVVALAVGAAQVTPTRIQISALLLVIVAAFGVIGTYDGLTAQEAIVDFANESLADGLPADEFDGGASWSALTFGIGARDKSDLINASGPYWVRFYATDTNPTHGVALEPLEGYEILGRRELPSLLHVQPVYVYLVRRNDPEGEYFFRAEDF